MCVSDHKYNAINIFNFRRLILKKLLKQIKKVIKKYEKWLKENRNNPAKWFIINVFYFQLLYMIQSEILKLKLKKYGKIQIGGIIKNEYNKSDVEVKL